MRRIVVLRTVWGAGWVGGDSRPDTHKCEPLRRSPVAPCWYFKTKEPHDQSSRIRDVQLWKVSLGPSLSMQHQDTIGMVNPRHTKSAPGPKLIGFLFSKARAWTRAAEKAGSVAFDEGRLKNDIGESLSVWPVFRS